VDGDFAVFAPANVSPLVAYLASPGSQQLNGQVLIVWGKQIVVVHGPYLEQTFDNPDPWTPEAVAATLDPFYAERTPITDGFVMSF
jgi:3-oxoacyl-[acyl-carrier protein] reductase